MDATSVWQGFLSVLFLPFLNSTVVWVWGAGDPIALAMAKRIFLMLPVLSLILAYWVTVLGMITVPFRADRRVFLVELLLVWWELGRGILTFWGGTFKFVLMLVSTIFNFVRLLIISVWVLIQDILFMPIRAAANVGESILNPGLPWIAVFLTLVWSVFESIIFTFVMTPLVVDTLSNLTGSALSIGFVRFPVFLFMLFIVLGSYSVLSSWSEALNRKDVPTIIKIGVIELVAMMVEVVFLYREFVDALVPWFAQHASGNFELGIAGTLLIAGLTWFGIRAVSWFLFASSGTPLIMAIIQGRTIKPLKAPTEPTPRKGFLLTNHLIEQMKSEGVFIEKYGEGLLAAFMLPPLQVIGAAINCFALLVITRHLFELPFKSVADLQNSRTLARAASQPPMGIERRRA
ncbi:MAG TPA: hypothetical protein VM598_04765 [Bdellovibrionota bacterium]|jgi:hypothetical protein|nr:hypothetical protein [Bdellovibrionota bacterium]